jgi:pyruvate dehydrogenase E2 component (dihydrolipoamide acetyltransferase)
MAIEVIMPALGMAQEKGTLLNWLKAEGDSVKKGEPLMEVETDKATVEVEAPASGILADVTAAAGDEIAVGKKIAVIVAPGETSALDQDPLPLPLPLPKGEGRGESRAAGSKSTPSAKPAAQTRPGSERILASPAARRTAKEKNVDLASLKGSGPEGSVVAEDALRAGGAPAASPAGPPRVKETVQPSAMRRIVGQRMSQSKQTAPHFYVGMDVDMSAVDKKRHEAKEKGERIIPSINDFILCASARALRDFPSLNAAFTDQGIQIFSDINVGMAVALEEGLVVPVIRNADRLSLQDMATQSKELAEKAQKKKLFPLDYEGGTFTVSNLGMLGVDSFVAIINPPQCAILAVGRVAPRAVPEGEKIAVRPMMTMTLSADHRIVDGAIAARFLQEVKSLLEKPSF